MQARTSHEKRLDMDQNREQESEPGIGDKDRNIRLLIIVGIWPIRSGYDLSQRTLFYDKDTRR